jgi:PGF-pre-PGF domain-containing protein
MRNLAPAVFILLLLVGLPLATASLADDANSTTNPLFNTSMGSPKVQIGTTVTLAGTGAEAGATIKVYLTNVDTGAALTPSTVTVGTDGTWVVTIVLTPGVVTKVELTQTVGSNESAKQLFGYVMADGTAPTVTISSPATGTSTDEAIIVVTGTIGKDPWETYTSGTMPVTATIQVGSDNAGNLLIYNDGSFAVTVALEEGQNYITITARDSGNIVSNTISVERTAGAGVLPVAPPATVTIENVSTNVGQTIPGGENTGITSVTVTSTTAILVNFEAAQPVKAISVTTTAAMDNVSVQAQQLAEKPAAVSAPTAVESGIVVSHYLEITVTPTGATSVQVANATIDFKVSKSWLTANNIDPATVKLMRYSDGWTELPTSATSEDVTYKYYSATTTGFSTFAVVGEVAQSNIIILLGISAVIIVATLLLVYVALVKRHYRFNDNFLFLVV